MGKGLLLGAWFNSMVSLVLSLISSFVPLWLVLREEVEENLCWWGEGIFTSRFWFGEDFDTLVPKATCSDPLGIGSISTSRAYCSNDPVPRINDKDPADYAQAMCQATNWAKVTSISVICLLALGMAICSLLLHWPTLNRATTRRVLFLGIALCALQVAASFATWVIMIQSPLFSSQHRSALSAEHEGIPFGAYASCSITSPFRSLIASITPASLQCLFPGPAYFCAFLVCMLQLQSLAFFYYRLRELDEIPFTLPVANNEGVQEEREENVLQQLKRVRVYSMYGSMARRTKDFRFQFVLITLGPFALAVIHAAMWAGFVIWGIQIVSVVNLSLVKKPISPLHEGWDMGGGTILTSIEGFEPLVSEFLQSKKKFLRYTINVFNFSPEMAISLFLSNGLAFVGTLSFVAMFVVPLAKSLAWVYFFFTPFDEQWKGWWLTVLDFNGKWQLAYMFVVLIQALGTSTHVHYILPLRPGHGEFLDLRSDVGIKWGGWGSVLLFWGCVVSLILGQVMLFVHQKTVKWEEQVRRKRELELNESPRGRGGRRISPSLLLATPLLRQPLPRLSNSHNNERLNALMQSANQGTSSGLGGECGGNGIDNVHGQGDLVEAMCDRTFEPERGVKLRWTVLGKAVWWFFFFLIGGTFTFAQLVELLVMTLTDMNVFVMPNPADRIRRFSLFSSMTMVLGTTADVPPYQIAFLTFLTLTLMPMVRLLAVAYLWVLPLTLRQQKRVFRFLEFSIAWSALEVYLFTLLVVSKEMPALLGPLSGTMLPEFAKIMLKLNPWMDGLSGARMELRPGFWFVAFIILVEKLVSGSIMAQAVTAISERQLQNSLLNGYCVSDCQTFAPQGENEEAEEALEAEAAALFFSPAMRYNTSVLYSRSYLYAGIPRTWWTSGLIRGGLLGEASLVQQFGSPSIARSFQAMSLDEAASAT